MPPTTSTKPSEPTAAWRPFEDVAVLPEQFTSPAGATRSGVCHLMAAVLGDAVDSYCKNYPPRNRRERGLHREAEEWILSEDESRLFAFGTVCDTLGIDRDALRAGLVRWKAEHPRGVSRTRGRVARQLSYAA